MASTKGRILGLLGSWILNEADVEAVVPMGDHFVVLRMRTDAALPYQPGDKLQILLPSREVRTYTPIGGDQGRFELLAFRHGLDSPAMRWLGEVQRGDVVQFVGPHRSLTLPEGRLLFVGDETAIGVAATYRRARPEGFHVLFEVADGVELGPILERYGLQDAKVLRRYEPLDLADLEPTPDLQVGIAGGGELVQRIRAQLRGRGVSNFKVKTYWLEGRAGLD